jgi:hypothetical protein
MIIDSGCTRPLMPIHRTFINFKPCLHAYVALADRSKVPTKVVWVADDNSS